MCRITLLKLFSILLLIFSCGLSAKSPDTTVAELELVSPESVKDLTWKHATRARQPRMETKSPAKGRLLSDVMAPAVMASTDSEFIGTFIQPGHSGTYYNVNQSGHGVFVEVIEDKSSQSTTGIQVAMSWFAFLDGKQIWLIAQGPVTNDGNEQVAVMNTWIFNGNDFPPFFDTKLLELITWGETRLRFDGCEQALLSWNSDLPEYGSGELVVSRLTEILDSFCDPNLGGNPRTIDDHGDDWTTATEFTGSGSQGITGNIDFSGDLDVFLFSLPESGTVRVYTTGTTDTSGALYRISGDSEIPVDTNNDSGEGDNFLMEESLSGPGTQYSLHVSGQDGAEGAYSVWLESVAGKQTKLQFKNNLFKRIQLWLNAKSIGSLPLDSIGQISLFLQVGDTVSFEVENDDGDEMAGEFEPVTDEDLGGSSINYAIENIVGGTEFFMPFIINQTATDKLLGVNMDLPFEKRTTLVLPADGTETATAYYKLFSSSNCRLYEVEDTEFESASLEWVDIAELTEARSGRVRFTAEECIEAVNPGLKTQDHCP
jgi:hypothetical protein